MQRREGGNGFKLPEDRIKSRISNAITPAAAILISHFLRKVGPICMQSSFGTSVRLKGLPII